jgi:predicted small metal-binding protein
VARKVIDCREYPSEAHCTIAISADSDDELVEAACQHAVAVHKHADSPELRAWLREAVTEGSPA